MKQLDNNKQPRSLYFTKIGEMTDEQLLQESEQKIWLSAYANSNPRSDYHWQADACYDEWKKRGKIKQYTVAYEAAKKTAGH